MKPIRSTLSSAAHRYLRIPYTLNVHEFQSPKKPRATFVFIHGIGNTLYSWEKVVAKMPRDVRLIGIDLLGFGESPKPEWAVYNARTQARSVGVTLLKMGLFKRVILVGHSLGSLVAVEVARRYPQLAQQLVLCSPPFYLPRESKGRPKNADDTLRYIYTAAKKHPEQFMQLSSLAVKMGLANKTLSVNDATVASYMAALEASIINQTSLRDIAKLSVDMDIFYGALDPVVVGKHVVRLAKEHDNITAHKLVVGHEIVGRYASTLGHFLARMPTNAHRQW